MIAPVVALLLLIQTSPASPTALPASVAEVGVVLDRLHDAASTADADVYFDLFTPDARFIGTDVTERWTVDQFRAYAMPYFSQGKGWTYEPRERVVTLLDLPCQCVAAFDEVLDNAGYGVTRGSGVLLKTEAGWKIHQYVLSYAVPNAVARDVTALIRTHEAATPPTEPAP